MVNTETYKMNNYIPLIPNNVYEFYDNITIKCPDNVSDLIEAHNNLDIRDLYKKYDLFNAIIECDKRRDFETIDKIYMLCPELIELWLRLHAHNIRSRKRYMDSDNYKRITIFKN